MEKKSLRTVEKQILSQLELNSRMPFSQFGRKIRKSQQQISYTVNSLVERGVIDYFYTIIDYSKLNILNFRVYFKVNYIDREKFEKLLRYLVEEPHISWIALCGGRYDLICTFFTVNPSQFNKNLRTIMQQFPELLQNYTVLTTVVQRIFGRKYLFPESSKLQGIIIGGDREPEDIDAIDMQILSQISEDARKSSVQMSGLLDLTPKTIMQRIKKLQQRKIIRGFKPMVNPRKVGHISSMLMIKYHNVSPEMENELINYLKMHPHVISAVKTLGEWNIEVRLEGEERVDLRKVEMEIRQQFALLIQQIESIPLYQSFRLNYFPYFLLEEIKKTESTRPQETESAQKQ